MATLELSIAEKLKQLYQLQLVDSKIDQIAILKGELPMEVSDLEDEIIGLETRVSKLAAIIEDLEGEVSRHNANLKEAEALIARYEKQTDNVKNDREYNALQKELEIQKLEILLSEKKSGEIKGVIANKEETLKATQERLDLKIKDLDIKKVELEKIIEKTEKDTEKLIKKSERAKKKIDERLLKAYLKVRTAYRNGLGVVTVERDSCGGCFNQIPPQVQLEIGMRKKVIACEHCGRVLVDTNILIAEPVENDK